MKKQRESLYRTLVWPVLSRMDPEKAHRLALLFLAFLQRFIWLCSWLRKRRPAPWLKVVTLGRTFSSPIGVAAGFDKNAEAYNALGALGFGFVEVGSVTSRPRKGLFKPRVFRLPDHSILNRMGLPNIGILDVLGRLILRPSWQVVVGLNVAVTEDEQHAGFPRVFSSMAWLAAGKSQHVQYIVLNLSCPNNTGVKIFHQIDQIDAILRVVQETLVPLPIRIPLLIKISPDLTDVEIDQIADLAVKHGIQGIVATNTMASQLDGEVAFKSGALTSVGLLGGLSGRPLRSRSLYVVRRLYNRSAGKLTIIASGGIETPDDAWAAICAGASLVQVFTALVYQGPLIAWKLQKGLAAKLKQSPFHCLEEAIGSEHRVLFEPPDSVSSRG
jgi:dihydroorotate dehydrogenase